MEFGFFTVAKFSKRNFVNIIDLHDTESIISWKIKVKVTIERTERAEHEVTALKVKIKRKSCFSRYLEIVAYHKIPEAKNDGNEKRREQLNPNAMDFTDDDADRGPRPEKQHSFYAEDDPQYHKDIGDKKNN